MSNIQTVCVYCGSSSNVDDAYKNEIKAFGQALGTDGKTAIYGGGHVGLMGLLADATLETGGKVIGIIPTFLDDREKKHENLTELHVVDSMHERKQKMAELADAFVVMPGGFGTLDEFFEILTWRQLGLHDRPIILVNTEGYWDALIQLIDHIIKSGFAQEKHRDGLTIVDDAAAAIDFLQNHDIDHQQVVESEKI